MDFGQRVALLLDMVANIAYLHQVASAASSMAAAFPSSMAASLLAAEYIPARSLAE